MKKKMISITPMIEQALKAESERTGEPETVIIRTALRKYFVDGFKK